MNTLQSRCALFVHPPFMKKQDVIDHFGSLTNVARQLGVTKAAISQWPEDIPEGRDYQIEVITKGALKANPRTSKDRRADLKDSGGKRRKSAPVVAA